MMILFHFKINFLFLANWEVIYFFMLSFNFLHQIECMRMCHLVSNEILWSFFFFFWQSTMKRHFCYYCHVVNINFSLSLLFLLPKATQKYSTSSFVSYLDHCHCHRATKKAKNVLNKKRATQNRLKWAFDYIIMGLFSMHKRFSSFSFFYYKKIKCYVICCFWAAWNQFNRNQIASFWYLKSFKIIELVEIDSVKDKKNYC